MLPKSQFCKINKISLRTCNRWARIGKITTIKKNGKIYIIDTNNNKLLEELDIVIKRIKSDLSFIQNTIIVLNKLPKMSECPKMSESV